MAWKQAASGAMAYAIRAYRSGDDERLVDLWNRCYSRYAGVVTRTLEYWRWTILARPGVKPEDILVLASGEQVLAYGVVWTDGDVLDLAVDSEQRPRKRRAILRTLISAMEERARARGCDALSVMLPASDPVLDKTLRDAGYVVEHADFLSLGILNPQALITQLLSRSHTRLLATVARTFVIELKREKDPFLPAHRLLVRLGAPVRVENVSDGAEQPADCHIAVSLGVLTEIIFCRAAVSALVAAFQIEIRPAARLRDACDLLNALAIDADWYTPLSDTF